MSLPHYGDLLSDGHAPGAPVPSGQFNTVVRVLDSQVVGALSAVGEGVIGTDHWLVTAGTGLDVNIGAGAGIRESAEHGHVFMATTASQNLDGLPSNSTVYVYATLVFREDPEDPDSREDATEEFTYNTVGGPVADSLLLAHFATDGVGISGEISDDREFIPATQALSWIGEEAADLTAIREAIGTGYFGETPPAASLDARVDDLELAPTGATFWGVLKKAAGDSTTVDQQIDADVQAHVDEYHQGDQDYFAAAELWDEDAVNQARGVLKLVRSVDPEHPLHMVDSIVLVWGKWGDGSGGSPDYVDRINSTWLV